MDEVFEKIYIIVNYYHREVQDKDMAIEHRRNMANDRDNDIKNNNVLKMEN